MGFVLARFPVPTHCSPVRFNSTGEDVRARAGWHDLGAILRGDGLSGQQLTSVMPCDAYVKNGAWSDRCVQPHGHELLRAAGAVALGANPMLPADLRLQMC